MSSEAPVKRLHQALLKHIDNCEETDKAITQLRCVVDEQQQEIEDGVREVVSTIGGNLRRRETDNCLRFEFGFGLASLLVSKT